MRAGALRSVHDVAEGGLAVALAEACLAGGLGATVDLSPLRPAGEALLFGEGPGAFVVSGPEQSLRAFGSAATRIGTVTGSDLVITGELSARGQGAGRPRGRPRGPAQPPARQQAAWLGWPRPSAVRRAP